MLQVPFVECAVPSILLVWVSSMAVLFLILFTDFYIKEYRRKGKHQVRLKLEFIDIQQIGVRRN